ncbi:hypothetical protein, partial [Herbiconiux daphne]
SQLQATKHIPELPKEAITPAVVTGLEAIGRGQDLSKLTDFMQLVATASNLQSNQDINTNVLILRGANAIGIDTDGILRSDEEKAQMMAQQAVQSGAQNFAGTLGAGAAGQATSSPEAMQQAADNTGLEPTTVGQAQG